MADQDDLPYIVIERRSGGIGAFLLGAAVGACAALLFAPRSGEQTRDELRSGVQRLRDRAQQTVRDLQSSVTDTIDGVRTEVTGRVEAAREAFEAGRQAARDTRTDLERRVTETRARARAGYEAARKPPLTDTAGEPYPAPASAAEPEANLGV
jgi:gas vesicle protein